MSQDSSSSSSTETDRGVRRVLFASAIWTLAVWGSRLGLIEDDASTWTRGRLAPSLLFGLILLILAWQPTSVLEPARIWVMVGYAMWMVAVWVPSLIDVLGSDWSAAFQLVHTALAIGSLISGAVIANNARTLALYKPTITSTKTPAKSPAR